MIVRGLKAMMVTKTALVWLLLACPRLVVSLMNVNCTKFQTREEFRYSAFFCRNSFKYADSLDDLFLGDQGRCTDSNENIRGIYCAEIEACTLTFYQASADDKTADPMIPSAQGCSADHVLPDHPVLKVDIKNWADVCVGDFARCYSLARHQKVYERFFCMDQHAWEFPAEASYMSVDCTADLQAKIQRVEKSSAEKRRKKILKYIWIPIVILVVLCVLCCCWFGCRRMESGKEDKEDVTLVSVLCCGYLCVVQKVFGASGRLGRREREGLLKSQDENSCDDSTPTVSETSKRNSNATKRSKDSTSSSVMADAYFA